MIVRAAYGADKIAPQEKSIFDRSVGNIYREYLKNYQGESPTLKNLYDDLMKRVDPKAHRIALALELFTTGSLDVSSHQTNINTKSRRPGDKSCFLYAEFFQKDIRKKIEKNFQNLPRQMTNCVDVAEARGVTKASVTVAAGEAAPETPETPEETEAEPEEDAEEAPETQADGETEVPVEPEAPTEYTATISDNDYAKGFYGIEYTLKTTDPKGEGLTGKVELVDNFGEWASVDGNASHTDWVQTDRCKEWKIIADKLKNDGLNVDTRRLYVFNTTWTDADGNAVTLDTEKTTVDFTMLGWSASNYGTYKVYLYNTKTQELTEETAGTHSCDYAGYGTSMAGMDSCAVPADCKIVYVGIFAEDKYVTKLAPGAYTVDADLTVLGKNNQILNGTQVYLSNPAFPPTAPVKQKGYLVVAEDGAMTLTMDGFNAIFAQLNIESGAGVTVQELRWADSTCPGGKRIDGITLKIDNYNGYYNFSNCKQYATPFEMEVQMQLDLIVDFSTAVESYVRPGEGETAYTKTFTDETTGISVQVDTTEEWGQKLADASMNIHYLKEGDAGYADAKFQADRLYKNRGNSLKILALDLTDKDGNALEMTGNSQATVSGVDTGIWANPKVVQMNGDITNAVSVIFDQKDSKLSFTLRNLNPLLVAGQWSKDENADVRSEEYGKAQQYVWGASVSDDGSYSIIKYMMVGASSPDCPGVSSTYMENNIASVAKKETTAQGDQYYAKLDHSYSFANETAVAVKFPYDASKPYYYFVMDVGSSKCVKQFTDSTIYNGSVYFSIIDMDAAESAAKEFTNDNGEYDKNWTIQMMKALDNGYNDTAPSESNPVAYILNSDQLYASDPIKYSKDRNGNKKNALAYTGLEQTENFYVYNDSVTLTGNTATDAGTYTMTATPVGGRTWLDGTSAPKEISWTIAKETVTVKYAGETIHEGETPALTLTYLGLVNGETPETAKGFKPATITAPETLTAGSYTLTSAGGEADNYEFDTYKAGTLLVVSADTKIIDKPTAVPGKLLANGEEQVGVPEGEGYTLSGDWKATDGGKSYTATATLKDGYAWSGGASGPCKISWTLYNGVEKPVFEKTVFEYTGELIKLDPDNKYSYNNGYAYNGSIGGRKIGDYTAKYTPNSSKKCLWTDGTDDPVVINWSIVEKIDSGDNGGGSSGGSTEKDKVTTVTANLYLPGEYNQVLPGITVYLNNSNNPIQGTGTPTVPKANNAKLTTKADGTMLLTLDITNPVFTLQKIDGCKNATVKSTKTSSDVLYQGTASGKYSERISQITVELNDKSGVYEFRDCTESPPSSARTGTIT